MFVDISQERLARWESQIDASLIGDGLTEAVIQALTADSPNLEDKIALLVRAQPPGFFEDAPSLMLYRMATMLHYAPEWIGAPIEEVALSALKQAQEDSVLKAEAALFDGPETQQPFDYLLSAFVKDKLVPSRFIFASGVSKDIPPSQLRTFGEHNLFFGFMQTALPVQDGVLTASLPIYALEEQTSKLIASSDALQGVWDKWEEMAQYVGHDDIHQRYNATEDNWFDSRAAMASFQEKTYVELLIGIARSGATAGPSRHGLDPRETFARSLHASRMRHIDSNPTHAMADDFLKSLTAWHQSPAPIPQQEADDLAFFLTASYLDHIIADRHQLNDHTLALFQNAMERMNLSITADIEAYELLARDGWCKLLEYSDHRDSLTNTLYVEEGGSLSGLPALIYANLLSGSKNAQYAYMDLEYRRDICQTDLGGSGLYISTHKMAELIQGGIHQAALQDPLTQARMERLQQQLKPEDPLAPLVGNFIKNGLETTHAAGLSLNKLGGHTKGTGTSKE